MLYLDPNGKEVTATLNIKTKILTVMDNDSGKIARVEAFTGGNSRNGSIMSPGTGNEAPIPSGEYLIVDNPNPTAGHEDWYGVFKVDDRIDDYFTDAGKERSGIRLHKGETSWGCVTVNARQPNADLRWERVIGIIDSTKTGTVEFRKGPHWWNSTGEITKYGTLKVINE